MKLFVLLSAASVLAGAAHAQSTPQRPSVAPRAMQAITPGLAGYTDEVLFGDVWLRPGLAPRDRSLVTVSALIATGKTAQLEGHLGRALNNGVQPAEAAAIVTQLAFYAGWPSAVSALEVYEKVFAARDVDMAALRTAGAGRPAAGGVGPVGPGRTDAKVAAAAPKFAELSDRVVSGDLWRRSDLSPRDRSLVTIAALAAMGEDDQLDAFLRRGLEAGLTREQLSEALTHLAFYAGWPKATKALKALAATAPVVAASGPEAGAAASNFTGAVSVVSPFRGDGGSRLGGATVTFAPGARTKWHSHPLGQLLVVTDGHGWIQIQGEAVRALRPGDVVWTPPGVKHWHGGTRVSGMTHVAVAETQAGSAVRWLEPVSNAEFQGPE